MISYREFYTRIGIDSSIFTNWQDRKRLILERMELHYDTVLRVDHPSDIGCQIWRAVYDPISDDNLIKWCDDNLSDYFIMALDGDILIALSEADVVLFHIRYP